MGKIIGIFGGKGGVGKTTLTKNLAHAFHLDKNKVLAIDCNIFMPHLSLYLGIIPQFTIHDIFEGKSDLEKTIFKHKLGFEVLAGSLKYDRIFDFTTFKDILNILKKERDVILLDTPTGLTKETINFLEICDDFILVTSPERPSLIDCIKIKNFSENNLIGIVVNRRKGSLGLKNNEIEKIIGSKVICEISEDSKVYESNLKGTTILDLYPNHPTSSKILNLAKIIIGKNFEKEDNLVLKIADWISK